MPRNWRSFSHATTDMPDAEKRVDSFQVALSRIGMTDDGAHVQAFLTDLVMTNIDSSLDEGALRQALAERTVAQKLLTVLKGDHDNRDRDHR